MTASPGSFPSGWFPVATSAELKRKPLRRRLCGIPLVIYRDDQKRAVALHDRCPHRSAPLSDGRVVGGEIECPYHGWRFGGDGRCTLIPFHDGDLPRRFVPSVPVQERHGLVFAQHGDGGEIYEPYWDDDRKQLRKIIPTEVETSLINVVENVLDPTHTAFTHKTLMRGMSESRQTVGVELTEEQPGMLQLVFTGEQRQDGLISRLTGDSDRTGNVTRILNPGIVEVVYSAKHKINIVTTIFFSPVDEGRTRGFIILTTPLKYGFAYIKSIVFIPIFRMIVEQDRKVLRSSYANWKEFGSPQNAVSPHDYMRPNLEALLSGREPPVAQQPLSFSLNL